MILQKEAVSKVRQPFFVILTSIKKANHKLICLKKVTPEVHFSNTFIEDLNKLAQVSSLNKY